MSPVQIWVLASLDAESVVTFPTPDSNTDRVFNNADSFAMVFDHTWQKLGRDQPNDRNQDQRLEEVFKVMADHPFVINSPDMARQVAAFRIRLLDLS